MNEDDTGNESFEDKVRAIAREVSRSVERLADFNMDEIADAIGVDAERAKQLADTAARWLNGQAESFGEGGLWSAKPGRTAADQDPRGAADPDPRGAAAGPDPRDAAAKASSRRAAGPHPLDLPTPDQGLALSALDSGRWTVEPGSNAFSTHGEGPPPSDALGLVGELRARDWIDADGAVTLVGRNALRRWLDDANPK